MTISCVSDDEFGEKSVSVLLDGEESEIVFIDHPAHEMSVSALLSVVKGRFPKAEDLSEPD